MVAELCKASSQLSHPFLEASLLLVDLAYIGRRGGLLDHGRIAVLGTLLTGSLRPAFRQDHARHPKRELPKILDLDPFHQLLCNAVQRAVGQSVRVSRDMQAKKDDQPTSQRLVVLFDTATLPAQAV
jgi:hypothetical protein